MHDLDNKIAIWIAWEHFSYKIKNFDKWDIIVWVSDRVIKILRDYAKDHNFNNEELIHIDSILANIIENNPHLFMNYLIANVS